MIVDPIAPEAAPPVAAPEPDLVYTTDSSLRLVATDAGWERFARENGGVAAAAARPSVLDAFSGAARVRWAGIYDKLLSGQLPGYSEQFTCPSPTLRRTYQLTIAPRLDAEERVVALVHRTRLVEQVPIRRKDRRAAAVVESIRDDLAPCRPGLHLVGRLRPLDEVGGDLIWERHRDDGRRVVVIADVMGHGALAGRVARLIEEILAGLPGDAAPGVAVWRLNDELIRRLPEVYDDTMFATGLYLDVDPARSRLRVSNFAHFGLLFSEKGMIDPPGGLPIGMFPADGPWPEVELDYAALGRRLMAYTDGIVEQFNPGGAMFGLAGLHREFFDGLDLDLAASLDQILARVDQFRGDALVKDDQSLLGIELAA